jgi:hypothetical protein
MSGLNLKRKSASSTERPKSDAGFSVHEDGKKLKPAAQKVPRLWRLNTGRPPHSAPINFRASLAASDAGNRFMQKRLLRMIHSTL